MGDNTEAKIHLALLAKATAVAEDLGLLIAMPNGEGPDGLPFQGVNPGPTAMYLRANVIPVPTRAITINWDGPLWYRGMLQIDVVQGNGGGSVPMQRTVGSVIRAFPQGTIMTAQDLDVQVVPNQLMQVAFAGPLVRDGTAWMFVPVSVPYQCFAKPS